MGLLNICSYETTKDNVSNLIALINRYHPAGQIKPKIKGNIVRLDIISDSTLDFWYMLPSFSFTYKNDLTKKQLMVKKYIESLFFERLRLKHTDSNIIMIRYNVKISYKELLEIIQSLKFSVKLLPIPEEEMAYIGIGSDVLGFYIMSVFRDYASDSISPHFNIYTGFTDPLESMNNESRSTQSCYDVFNKYFALWKNNKKQPIFPIKLK
jgi:hypothetical protein